MGDAINDANRNQIDRSFDRVVRNQKIQSLPRAIVVELAALDGAIVLANSGQILAYGAILQPRRTGRIRGTEGSRTKAAIGASNYGLAIKVSADGDVGVYYEGDEFIHI
jgi:DNA integrity scanning protein DisA with diadenylate cyclase activity